MKTLLIILGVLVLLALIPLGTHVRYDAEGPRVALVVGPIKIGLIPKKPKKTKKTKKTKDQKEKKQDKKQAKKKEKKKKPEQPKQKQPIGGLIRDFYPFVKIGLDLLGCFFRKLRIRTLTLHLGFPGANDPAAAAINYGRAWSAIGAIMQPIRSATRIKKENVSCSCDFTSGDMRVFAELKAVFLLGDLVVMAVRYGFRALRQYLKLKKDKKKNLPEKGGASNESSSS